MHVYSHAGLLHFSGNPVKGNFDSRYINGLTASVFTRQGNLSKMPKVATFVAVL
jgi:hypothetical protein